ncbi:MAG TPA: FkbM family methyltransferase [Caulobacteraceae bacterium]|nr:FkbM family methyltransferase [Caulobacteraceae bacterium]
MTERPPPTLPADGFNALAACRRGPMLYNRNDQYVGASLARYGEFSRGESDLFGQIVRPGATVVEGGANIGVHTVEFSQRVGPGGSVWAFEPQRIVFQTLCANLALNSCVNVRAFQAGLGVAAAR